MAKDTFYIWKDRFIIFHNLINSKSELPDALNGQQEDGLRPLNFIQINPWYFKLSLINKIKPLKFKKITKKPG